jgi:hypothetical protein
VLSVIFQGAAWLLCFVVQDASGSLEHSGGVTLNGRTWCVSCSLYWLAFLIALLITRDRPIRWLLRCLAFAYPVMFVAAAALLWRFLTNER